MWHEDRRPESRPGSIAFAVLLALPALVLVVGLASGQAWRWGIGPSGDLSAKLLITALAISPLRVHFPAALLLKWLESRRRMIGLAAFAYALLHLTIFAASIGRLDWIIQGLAFASMWTGWIAFFLLTGIASISSQSAQARLGKWWKSLQRLSIVAALFVLAHWLLLTRSPVEALLHFLPLFALRLSVWLPRS